LKIIGIGQINVWDGGSLWIGLAQAGTGRHAHHAIQVSIGLKGGIRIQSKETPDWKEYGAFLVPPHVPHAFEAFGSVVANIFCEPESIVGRALLARFGSEDVVSIPENEATALSARIHDRYAAGVEDEELNRCARDALARLAQQAAVVRLADPRIAKAVVEIGARLDRPISLSEIAKAVHLSPGRFRHLFVAETGMPLRPYLLWRRLQHALALGVSGRSWTEAAHAANFADSAHLTRTFRKMFGVAPSALGGVRREEGRGGLIASA
jgi:AraC-like DNA-binding protein